MASPPASPSVSKSAGPPVMPTEIIEATEESLLARIEALEAIIANPSLPAGKDPLAKAAQAMEDRLSTLKFIVHPIPPDISDEEKKKEKPEERLKREAKRREIVEAGEELQSVFDNHWQSYFRLESLIDADMQLPVEKGDPQLRRAVLLSALPDVQETASQLEKLQQLKSVADDSVMGIIKAGEQVDALAGRGVTLADQVIDTHQQIQSIMDKYNEIITLTSRALIKWDVDMSI